MRRKFMHFLPSRGSREIYPAYLIDERPFFEIRKARYRGEWGKMPRRVRRPTPSPGEVGGHT